MHNSIIYHMNIALFVHHLKLKCPSVTIYLTHFTLIYLLFHALLPLVIKPLTVLPVQPAPLNTGQKYSQTCHCPANHWGPFGTGSATPASSSSGSQGGCWGHTGPPASSCLREPFWPWVGMQSAGPSACIACPTLFTRGHSKPEPVWVGSLVLPVLPAPSLPGLGTV